MRFLLTPEAQAQLRDIDRAALRILETLARFGQTREGDVEPLQGEWHGLFRLRIGDYRAIFRYVESGLEILTVGHRSDVYR